jgi:hypothetical protein
MSSVAGRMLPKLRSLVEQAPERRKVSPEEVGPYIEMLHGPGGAEEPVAAALILAWAEDERSAQALQPLIAHPAKSVAGAAMYALGIRQLRTSGKDYFEGLCELIRGATNDFAVLFFANRLWADFGDRSLAAILDGAVKCRDRFVRWYLLRYLALTESPEFAQKVLLHTWEDGQPIGIFDPILDANAANRLKKHHWHGIPIPTSALLEMLRRTVTGAPRADWESRIRIENPAAGALP